jgi:hypothetical protein
LGRLQNTANVIPWLFEDSFGHPTLHRARCEVGSSG